MNFTSRTLSIISFNAMSAFNFDSFHGFSMSMDRKLRLDEIAKALKEKDPDIIAFQEIHFYWAIRRLKKVLNYPYVSYKKFIYGPRGGLVLFSKFPVEKTDYIDFKLRGNFFDSSFIAHVIRNGILLCKFKDIPLTVFNVHATPNLDHNHSRNNRFIKYTNAQLRQISGIVKSDKFAKENLIVAGDFNVAKNSHSYKKFVEISELTDVFKKYDFPTQHQEFLPRHKKVKRIDYIFVNRNGGKLKLISEKHLFTEKVKLKNGKKRYLSDHLGLQAVISF